MGLVDKIQSSGIEVMDQDKDAIHRKEELVNSSKNFTLSEASIINYRNMAVKMGLVPDCYRNAEFSEEKVKENVRKEQALAGHRFTVKREEDYFNTVNSIMTALKMKRLPDRSYVIGAPNGFGKQSFAVDCIITSLYNGWKTVPYISLSELSEIKVANDKVLMKGLIGVSNKVDQIPFNYLSGSTDVEGRYNETYYSFTTEDNDIKRPTIITGQYSWSEYINAPVLLCFFSGVENKALESQMLMTLLNIRSAKGFPTIALISTSLDPYRKDPMIGRYIWNEIESYDPEEKTYGKVLHVSCFKDYSDQINKRRG